MSRLFPGFLLAACAALAGTPACAASPRPAAPAVDHVVVITVDGVRPDAVAAAPAPHLQALMAAGIAGEARAVEMPETLPSHLTMASGLPPSVHGVTFNIDRGAEFGRDTLFSRVHAAGGRTGLYFGKSKLLMMAPRGSADVVFGNGPKGAGDERGRIGAVAARFVADFDREAYRLAWVHLREPDWEGHNHGWMSPQYLAALRAADAEVGRILAAIDASGHGAGTAVILTSDHGGEGDSHGADRTELSFRVPFACRVPGVRPGRLRETIALTDLAPTVLALLALPDLPDAKGRAVAACLPGG